MILVTYYIPYEGDHNIFCDRTVQILCRTVKEVKKAVETAKSFGEYPQLFVVSEISLDEAEDMIASAENDNG